MNQPWRIPEVLARRGGNAPSPRLGENPAPNPYTKILFAELDINN